MLPPRVSRPIASVVYPLRVGSLGRLRVYLQIVGRRSGDRSSLRSTGALMTGVKWEQEARVKAAKRRQSREALTRADAPVESSWERRSPRCVEYSQKTREMEANLWAELQAQLARIARE